MTDHVLTNKSNDSECFLERESITGSGKSISLQSGEGEESKSKKKYTRMWSCRTSHK